MARRQPTRKDDLCPREISSDTKPNIKLYDDYEEKLKNDGGVWVLSGFYGEDEYQIPMRTRYKFGAIHARYRLLLKGQIDKVDPNTGQVFPGDNRAAQFGDGNFETRDLFEVRSIYRSDAFYAGRIWDQDTESAKQREGAYQGMKRMLLGDKDFKERFLKDLADMAKPVEEVLAEA